MFGCNGEASFVENINMSVKCRGRSVDGADFRGRAAWKRKLLNGRHTGAACEAVAVAVRCMKHSSHSYFALVWVPWCRGVDGFERSE